MNGPCITPPRGLDEDVINHMPTTAAAAAAMPSDHSTGGDMDGGNVNEGCQAAGASAGGLGEEGFGEEEGGGNLLVRWVVWGRAGRGGEGRGE